MTYYTSWISDEELIQILKDDPYVQPNTINILKGGVTGEKKRTKEKTI